MSSRRLLVIQGHPDPEGRHFGNALADTYAEGATEAGHEVRRVEVALLEFPLLRTQHEWHHGALPTSLAGPQQDIGWAEHVVLFFPLWLGDMPALLKGFLEQVARPGFAFHEAQGDGIGKKALAGRSARVVVTMGMPAAVYRYFYRAHSVRSLERNVLGFVGFAPVHETLIGTVEGPDPKVRGRWLSKLREMGAQAA